MFAGIALVAAGIILVILMYFLFYVPAARFVAVGGILQYDVALRTVSLDFGIAQV